MFKFLIFLLLGLTILFLFKKFIGSFTNNIFYQYFFYFFIFLLFVFFIYLFKDNKKHDGQGNYNPPKFDGEKVIPGKVVNEKQ